MSFITWRSKNKSAETSVNNAQLQEIVIHSIEPPADPAYYLFVPPAVKHPNRLINLFLSIITALRFNDDTSLNDSETAV
jgi:hypothetical protein